MAKIKIISPLLLCFLLYQTGKGQVKRDTTSALYKKITGIYEAVTSQPSERSISEAKLILAEAEKQNNEYIKGWAFETIGYAFQIGANIDSSIYYLLKAQGVFKEHQLTAELLNANFDLVTTYNRGAKFNKSLPILFECDSLASIINSPTKNSNLNRAFAIAYRGLADYERAKQYFKRAMNDFMNLRDTLGYVSTAASLAILYRNMGHFDSSLFLTKLTLGLSQLYGKDDYQTAMVHEGVAESYLGLSQKENKATLADSSIIHYLKAYYIFKTAGNEFDMAWEAFSIGRSLMSLKRFSEAEKYLLQAFETYKNQQLLTYQLDAAQALYQLYESIDNHAKALEYLKLSYNLNDTLTKSAQINQANDLKEKYESKKKEQELNLLQAKHELTIADKRRANIIIYFFCFLFAAALAFIWLLRNRFEMKRRLETQLIRNQLASDLHDDIGSTLSGIQISSRIALQKSDDSSIMVKQLHHIKEQSQKIMESMGDIIWSIKPGNDSLNNLVAHMREFASNLCEPLEISVHFNTQKLEATTLNADERRNFFLIFKEAINNACKYSMCKNINIEISSTHSEIQMKVSDDGKGFEIEKIRHGNGLTNMKVRAKHLEAHLNITSQMEKGTEVLLLYPQIGGTKK